MTGESQWPTYEPSPGASEPGSEPPAVTHRPPTQPERPGLARRVRPARLVVWIGVMVAGGALAAGVFALADSDGVPGLGAPDALSAEGLDQLRDDVREESGGTEVFGAVIYPGYASVDVPVDATSQREKSMHWDGDLSDFGGKGTATNGRVDLVDVDADVMLAAIDEAKSLVEDPNTWYVIIGGPDTGPSSPEPASISVYASNEYSETAYVEVSLGGKEIRRYVSTDG